MESVVGASVAPVEAADPEAQGIANGNARLVNGAVALERRNPTVDEHVNPLLELYDIVKQWPAHPTPILDHVGLVVERGAAIHLGGRNGIGKTTLLRIASGLIRPDEGIVSVDGLHPKRNRNQFQSKIGFLTAGDKGLYARLSVRRHLDFWARLSFVPARQRAERTKEVVRRFGLEPLSGHRVDRLSMGQRQRVRLAGLFLNQPELVLLDEPRNSLDEDGIAAMVSALHDVLRQNGAVVWCSPSGEQVELDFDATYLLEDGRLVGR